MEDFFRNPEFQSFQVSPDGTTLAVLMPYRDSLNVFVFDIESGEARRLTGYRRNSVNSVFWASNERLLYRIGIDGSESFGLYAIGKDGSRPRELVKPQIARSISTLRTTEVINMLWDDPDHVLVVNNDRLQQYPDVYRLSIVTEGSRQMVERNPGNVVRWVADRDGVVRMGMVSDRDKEVTTRIYRASAEDEWQDLATFGDEDPGWSPLAFDFDGETLYVGSSLDRSTSAVYTYDLENHRLDRLIQEDDRYDVAAGTLFFSHFAKSFVGLRYDADKPVVRWFSEERRLLQDILDQTFPDTVNLITSASHDDSRLVVTSFSDRHSPFFNLVTIGDDGALQLMPLGNSRPWIDPEGMRPMRSVDFTSRDDKLIQGFLTLPAQYEEGRPVPMIVHPHGGPWARDFWGFNPEVQFMANRGFAVFQINFRGSTGFGREFELAGSKTWGTDMQNDVIDGVRWAIDQGYAHPDKIGIYGASYGGYTTMMQLVLYPEVYNFGINYVGVVSLPELIENRRREEEVMAFYSRRIGDLREDRELLREFSPINFIDRLQAPVLIVHGTQDFRVPIQQAHMLRSAMRRHNKPYEWLVKTDEGHGFWKEENNFELYRKMDEFLKPFRPRL